jgi:hypothetical protein
MFRIQGDTLKAQTNAVLIYIIYKSRPDNPLFSANADLAQ